MVKEGQNEGEVIIKMKRLLLICWLVITILLPTTDGYAGYMITQFPNAGSNPRNPDINNNGQIAWEAIGEIFLYDGNARYQLTDNDTYDGHPQFNNNGNPEQQFRVNNIFDSC